MPAYMVAIDKPECIKIGCRRPASHEVKNGQNALMGRYCKPHAMEEVARLNRTATA